jgi:peptide/nickel transport system substrate-binding protein
MGTYLQSVLNDLGFQTSLKPLSSTIFFTYVQNTNNQVQVSLTDWYQDYPTPSNFLNVLYSCASFRPGTDASINISGLCDKALDAEMNKALLTGLTDLKAAAAMWAAIDRKVTDSAAAANLLNPNLLNFTSRRLGNYVSGGQLYFIFTKAWVK